jgi:glycosyltransferase involved in cell wall biosynthesis
MPTVAILCPTYQHASYIGACIRSVLSQTRADWEMIIVDDGSTDGTADVAESFDDPRITVLRQEHAGVAGLGRSYARAVAHSSSPYLAILEGDDTWPPGKLADQIPFFDDPQVVLSYGAADLIDEVGGVYAGYRRLPRREVATNDPVGSALCPLIEANFIVAVTAMVRRSALDLVGGFFQPEGIAYVDHPTWLRLALTGTFAPSTRVLGNWRRHSSQITTRAWFNHIPDRTGYLDGISELAQGHLPPDEYEHLLTSIRRDHVRQREEAVLAHGRVALIQGNWQEASTMFRSLLGTGEPRSRVVAAAGVLCAACRTDMEWPIRALGRHSLPSRRHRSAIAEHRRPDVTGSGVRGS